MKRTTTTRLARTAGVALALFAGTAVAAALPHDQRDGKVAIVVNGADAQALATARQMAQDQHAQLRVVNTYADQLGATHVLAASGYAEIVTIGLDRRIAVAPVAEKYPGTEFVTN